MCTTRVSSKAFTSSGAALRVRRAVVGLNRVIGKGIRTRSGYQTVGDVCLRIRLNATDVFSLGFRKLVILEEAAACQVVTPKRLSGGLRMALICTSSQGSWMHQAAWSF